MQQNFSTRKTALAIAISVALGLGLAACGGDEDSASAPTASVTEMRTVTLLDKQSWNFVQDDNLTDAIALASSGSGWSSVKLPHSWNAKDAANTVQTTPTSVNYKRGIGWYRLQFDNTNTGATHWLQFDGASIVADVWLNGVKLGQHKGAFSTFRFDVTNILKPTGNVLQVKVNNTAAVNGTDTTGVSEFLCKRGLS